MPGIEPPRARPRLLAVTSELPWPLDTGGHLRTFHLLRSLTKSFDVTLVAPGPHSSHVEVAALQAAGIKVRVAEAAGRRVWTEAARVTSALVRNEPYVCYRRHDRSIVRRVFSSEREASHPDVYYLDHLDSMLFAGLCVDAPIVLDLHNVYSLLVQRAAEEQASVLRRAYLKREAALLTRAEERAVRAVDLVLAVSEQEASHFTARGAQRVCVVPNGVDCNAYAAMPTGRPISESPLIIFVGALGWQPNVSAVRFLGEEVMPQVRRRFPRARFRVVGKATNEELRGMSDLDGVEVLGSVPDVRSHLAEATLLAVPLDAGGGTRLKILEAFAAGLPVVSTPVGCEGIRAESGRELLVAGRPGFAEAVVKVLVNPDRAAERAQRARVLVENVYDWQIVGTSAAGALASMLAPREAIEQSTPA